MSDQDALLWPEEAAAVLGLERSATVRTYANWTKRKQGAGKPLTRADFPLPHDYAKRQVTTAGGHERTAVSPRWHAEAPCEACAKRGDAGAVGVYLVNRRGPGGRPAAPAGAS